MEVVAVCRPGSPNIANLTPHPRLQILELDIRDLKALPGVLEGPFDAFYHLAWEGTFGEGRNQPEVQLDNIRHTLDAVKAASDLAVRSLWEQAPRRSSAIMRPLPERGPCPILTPFTVLPRWLPGR